MVSYFNWKCTLTFLLDQLYKYHGCYTTHWSRKPNVQKSEKGVSACRNICKSEGFTLFGFECPMEADVHCECSNTLTASHIVDDIKCQRFNTASGNHCIGPFSVYTKFGIYYMGAGSLNSAYAVEPTVKGSLISIAS